MGIKPRSSGSRQSPGRVAARVCAVAACCAVAAAVLAAPARAQSDISPDGVTARPFAVLRGLNKQTARVQERAVEVGETASIYGLEVTVRKCLSTTVSTTPEDGVFLEIRDRSSYGENARAARAGVAGEAAPADAQTGPPLTFSGWMFSRNPSLVTLDHPLYDLWLKGCTASPRQVASVPVPAAKPSEMRLAAPVPARKPAVLAASAAAAREQVATTTTTSPAEDAEAP